MDIFLFFFYSSLSHYSTMSDLLLHAPSEFLIPVIVIFIYKISTWFFLKMSTSVKFLKIAF